MANIFLIGASGYIGGEALYQLSRSSLASEFTITCLNRDSAKGDRIRQLYPNVRIIQGDLDAIDLIKREATSADVVLQLADTKHVNCAKAIAAGKPKAWIQMSGATVYAAKEIAEGRFGTPSKKIWGDKTDRSEILKVIRDNPGRVVEQTVLAQPHEDTRTALVVGPLIYGLGRGPCHTRSIQAPEMVRVTLELGHGFQILEGRNSWSHVHVADVGSLICRLAEAAIAGKDIGWNEDGVYHAEVGAMEFKVLNEIIAQAAMQQGLLKDDNLERIDPKRADELSPHMSILCGTNAITRAEKARETLGWKPEGHSLGDEINDLILREKNHFAS